MVRLFDVRFVLGLITLSVNGADVARNDGEMIVVKVFASRKVVVRSVLLILATEVAWKPEPVIVTAVGVPLTVNALGVTAVREGPPDWDKSLPWGINGIRTATTMVKRDSPAKSQEASRRMFSRPPDDGYPSNSPCCNACLIRPSACREA